MTFVGVTRCAPKQAVSYSSQLASQNCCVGKEDCLATRIGQKARTVIAILLVVLGGLAVRRCPRDGIVRCYRDFDDQKKELQRVIPMGTPLHLAMQIMSNNGFACRLVTHGAFDEYDTVDKKSSHENISYIYCDRWTQQIPVLIGARYQVALVYTNGVVIDYLVAISGQGI